MRLGFGPGYGWGKSEVEDIEVSYSGGGFLVDIMLGGTIGNLVVIGGGLQLGQILNPDAEITSGDASLGIGTGDEGLGITTLGPFVDVYFGKSSGGHAGTMLGLGNIGLEGETDDEVSTGWGWSVFGGYEFWVSDQWALGADLRYTRVKGERVFGEVLDSQFATSVTVKDTAHIFGVMFSAVLN
jgi:opacity protein-like surface antigen